MAYLTRQTVEIPTDEIKDSEILFFRMIKMNREKLLKRFSSQYEEVRSNLLQNVSIKGVFESFKVDRIEDTVICLENGTALPSPMLSNLFVDAEEIVFSAITVEGYDRLACGESDNLKRLFYDGWGSALAEAANSWLKNTIKQKLSDENVNATFPWSPGQHEVDIKLQRQLFSLLKPEDIGITLTPSMMMHPQKSVSCFIGIGHSVEMETLRACDFCTLRKTCPAAYA